MGVDYTNNAINDILYGGTDGMDRFQGAIDSIAWITKLLDKGSIVTMSLVGYLVIVISLFRSAVTLLYCTFPAFFDAMHELKTGWKEKGSNNKSAGWLLQIASLFVPDVKSIAVMEDATQTGSSAENNRANRRNLMLKVSISSALFIFGGVAIYNGYYRDIVAKLADGGSYLLHEYVLTVDPKKVISNVLEQGKHYEFNYPGTPEGKRLRAIADKAYKAVTNYYPDMKSEENRWIVGANVENWVNTEVIKTAVPFGSASTIEGAIKAPEEYIIKSNAEIVPQTSDTTKLETDNSVQLTFYKPASSFGYVPSDRERAQDTSYVRLSILVQSKEYKQTSSAVANKLGKVAVTGTVYTDGNPGSAKAKYVVTIPSLANGEGMPNTLTIGSVVFQQGQSSLTDGYISYISNDAPNSDNPLPAIGQTSKVNIQNFAIGGYEAELTLTGTNSEGKFAGDINFLSKSWKGQPLAKFQEEVNEATANAKKKDNVSPNTDKKEETTTEATQGGASNIE